MRTFILTILSITLLISPLNGQDWQWGQNITSDGNIESVDIISDASGNVYVIGIILDGTFLTIGTDTYNTKADWDTYLCSFSSDGTYRWSKHIASEGRDDIKALTIDQYEGIYVVGSFRDETIYFTPTDSLENEDHFDSFLAKYDTDGNLIYAKRAFWGNDQERLQNVVVDKEEEKILLVGTFKDNLIYYDGSTNINVPSVGPKDLFIASFTYDSVFQDIVIYSTSKQQSTLKNIEICNAGGYFVTGDLFGRINFTGTDYIEGDLVNSDALVFRVDDNLDYMWARLGRGTAYENVNWAASDKYSNVYLTGKVETNGATFDSTATLPSAPLPGFGGADMYVAKYNRSGILRWVVRAGDSGFDNSYGSSISENLFYMIGNFAGTVIFGQDTLVSGSTSNVDVAFGVMDVKGNPVAAQATHGDLEDIGTGLAIKQSGNVVITGYYASPSLTAGPIELTNSSSSNADGFVLDFLFEFKVSWSKIKHVSCNGGNNGELIVTPYFGKAPYTYVWDHDAGLTDSIATGLQAGFYRVTVTDGNNSTAVATVTLNEPAAISITESITNVDCYGENTGSISVSISGGTGPYTQIWTGPGGFTSTLKDISGLFAGAYSITVKDSKGCTQVGNFNVTQPGQILFGGSVVTDIIRPPGSNGAIDLSVSGGTPSYTFDWRDPSDAPISTNEDLTGLDVPGLYTVYVTDQNACEADTSLFLAESGAFICFIDSVRNISCNGGSDGYIRVGTTGGTGPYTYDWRDVLNNPVGSDSPVLSGVPAGRYCVTVTDTDDMSTCQSCITLTEPAAVLDAALLQTNDVSCNDACDGSIEITVSGGTPPYSYAWTGPSFTSTDKDIFDICPGFYSVIVTDANGCTANISGTEITEPAILSVTVSKISEPLCAGELTGELCANVVGGSPPYNYVWNDPGNQVTQCADYLDGGLYEVTVTDANGCVVISTPERIDEPAAINASFVSQDITCNGADDGFIVTTTSGGTPPYSYLWTGPGGFIANSKDISNLEPGNYCLVITDNNNCTLDAGCVTILEPTALLIGSETTSSITCFGAADGTITITAIGGIAPIEYSIDGCTNFFDNGGVFTGLTAGTYNVCIRDANGCFTAGNTLVINEPPPILFTTAFTGISCFGEMDGTITISEVSGGTGTGFEFSIDGGTNYFDNGGVFTDLAAGDYDVTVRDSDGCEQPGSTITITEPLELTLSITDPACAKFQVTASGGTVPYNYNLTGEGLDISNATGDFSGLIINSGDYSIDVTDANGCAAQTDATISCELVIFNAFSPNDDGYNDLWNIYGIQAYPNAVVKVYNTWGTEVFVSKTGYSDPWNGKQNNTGNKLPSGTYYYVVDLGDGSDPLSGTVNIVK